MKLRSNVCNRCRLVRVKLCLNRSRFAVVVAKCKGLTFLGHTVHAYTHTHQWRRQTGRTGGSFPPMGVRKDR